MRRGRLFIYIALILIVGMALVYFFFFRGGTSGEGSSNLSGDQVSIVVAGRNVPRGNLITLEDLNFINIPAEQLIAGEFTDISLVVGCYAKYPMDQGVIITESVLGLEANTLGESVSSWAELITTGITAVSTTTSNDQLVIPKPDIVTLVVTPQEAITLTYLLNSGVQMTMTLRGPSDDVSRVDTEAATLQYLLSQYRIPVPPKLPYSLEPRVNSLVTPAIPR